MTQGKRKDAPTPGQERKRDRMAREVAGMTPEQLRDSLAKTAYLSMRVTPAEKADMEATAKALGLSLTEYLERMHALVSPRLKGK